MKSALKVFSYTCRRLCTSKRSFFSLLGQFLTFRLANGQIKPQGEHSGWFFFSSLCLSARVDKWTFKWDFLAIPRIPPKKFPPTLPGSPNAGNESLWAKCWRQYIEQLPAWISMTQLRVPNRHSASWDADFLFFNKNSGRSKESKFQPRMLFFT